MAGVNWRCWVIVSLLILITSYAACDISLQANNQSQEYKYTFSRFNTSSINETDTIIIKSTEDLIQLEVFSSKNLPDQACADGPIQIFTGQARLFHGSYCGGEEDYFSSSHPVLAFVVNTTSLPDDIEINFLYENTGSLAKITPSRKPRVLYTSNYPKGGSLYDSNVWLIRESYDASDLSTISFTLKYADANYKPDCALTNVTLETFHGGPKQYLFHKEHVWCGQEANTFSNTYRRANLFSLGQRLLESGLQIMIWTEEVPQCKHEIATTADTTVVQSPGFPYGYPQRMNCRWYVNLRQTDTYGYFLVKVDAVDIDCENDVLEILHINTSSRNSWNKIGCESEPIVMEYYTDYLLVWFVSGLQKNSSNHTGFSMTIQRLNDTSCYKELVATDSVQKLSFNATTPYHGICKWVIRVSNPVMVVKMHIKNTLPWCQNRQNRIYNDASEHSHSALNYVCGNGVLQVTSGYVKIVITNMTGIFGEEIDFWQGQYSRNLTGSSGTITYPLYPFHPGNYKSGADVTWTIRPPSKRIKLFFSQMDVNCGGDAVYISSGEEGFIVCGTQDQRYLLQTNSLVINFKATTDQGTGFHLRYRDTTLKECADSVIDVYTSWCIFDSPDYIYFDNLYCMWRIIFPIGERIKLTITVKDIKSTSPASCQGDYLLVYDGYSETSRTLARVCGANKEVTLESSGNQMYAEFITDSVLAGTGFRAQCSKITPGESGVNAGLIVGVIVVLLFGLVLACLLYSCINSRRHRARNQTQTATPLSEGQTQTVSPPFSESQTQTASPPPSYDELIELSPSSHNGLSTPPPTYDDVLMKTAEDFQINSQTVTSSL